MSCSLRVFHRPTPVKNLLLVLALVLAGSVPLLAQCDRIGRVISSTPGCGVVIKDLGTGQFFRIVPDMEALTGGETIRFGVEPAPDSIPCAEDGLPTMSLTCVGDLLAAQAQFGYYASAANPLQYTFHAYPYQPDNQTCQWSFGEGPLTDFSGNIAQHTFPAPGLYDICVKITDNTGNIIHRCQEVLVSTEAVQLCGYDAIATAVGTEVYAKLLPQSSNVGSLQTISWYTSVTGLSLGETANLTANLPGTGSYSICAQYEVKDTAGMICTASICKDITVLEPGCAIPQVANADLCPMTTVPVCGCNNVTYENECGAMAAGLTTWWEGDCSTVYGSCMADVGIKIIAGSPDAGYLVQFKNLSVGHFSLSHLDFGDGSPVRELTQWDSIVHYYTRSDVYRIDLSVWKQNACASSVTKILVTDASSLIAANLPATPDYVWPGDANGDTRANVYDLLNIGVGYLATGAPRPGATNDWVPQFAANWPDELGSTLNYKHFDCNGDGMVLDLDADLIEPHYSPIDSNQLAVIPGAPAVWLKFDQDTITVNPNNPAPLTITASVMVGSPEVPAINLYGLAFALKYPEYVEHDPEVEYKNDFFGISNHILWLPKDNYDRRQLDLGFTRKYQPASGYGRIATVTFETDFIIIIDVIDREVGDVKAFTVPIRGLKAVDADGQVIEFSGSFLQDTVWIKLLPTSATDDQTQLQQQVRLYPNPATGETRIFTGELKLERLEVANALGQVVYAAVPSGGQVQRLSVTGWASGLYTVRLQTAAGIVEKKLFVR